MLACSAYYRTCAHFIHRLVYGIEMFEENLIERSLETLRTAGFICLVTADVNERRTTEIFVKFLEKTDYDSSGLGIGKTPVPAVVGFEKGLILWIHTENGMFSTDTARSGCTPCVRRAISRTAAVFSVSRASKGPFHARDTEL